DLLWRNSSSGKNTIWYSAQQSRRKSLTQIADTRWEVVGVGDFDGDGEADIFWRHASSGKNTVWYSGDRDNRKSLRGVSDARWKVVAVGDFNGDGKRSEEHTSELQSRENLVCRLLLEKKKNRKWYYIDPSVPLRAGRNDPCPCGGGQKFKKC